MPHGGRPRLSARHLGPGQRAARPEPQEEAQLGGGHCSRPRSPTSTGLSGPAPTLTKTESLPSTPPGRSVAGIEPRRASWKRMLTHGHLTEQEAGGRKGGVAGPRGRRTAGRPVWQQEGRRPGEQWALGSHGGQCTGERQRAQEEGAQCAQEPGPQAPARNPEAGTESSTSHLLHKKNLGHAAGAPAGASVEKPPVSLPAAAESGARGGGGGDLSPFLQRRPRQARWPRVPPIALHTRRDPSWECQFPPCPAPPPQVPTPPSASSPFSAGRAPWGLGKQVQAGTGAEAVPGRIPPGLEQMWDGTR